MKQIWECKVGGFEGELPMGADLPMRIAIDKAYHEITGEWPEFTFSGWGGSLTKSQERVVEDFKARVEAGTR